MMEHVPHPHTPEEQRLFSNIGHWLEGGIITSGGVAVLSARDGHSAGPATVLAGAGSLLGLGLVAASFHHGGPLTFFRVDHQQRQHLEMAAILTAGSLAARFGKLGRLLSGASIARIGQMSLAHEQHGTSWAAKRARAKHKTLGKTILAAALAQVVGDLIDSQWIRATGGTLLIAAGLQLLTYREPEGAFEATDRVTLGDQMSRTSE